MGEVSNANQTRIYEVMRKRAEDIANRSRTPEEAEAASHDTIDKMYKSLPDGVDPETGTSVYTNGSDEAYSSELVNTDPTNLGKVYQDAAEENKRSLMEERRFQSPAERAPATPQRVQQTVPRHPVGDGQSFLDRVRNLAAGRNPVESEEIKQAKRESAHSKRTAMKPEVAKVIYGKDVCTSQGQTITYKVAAPAVEWDKAIKSTAKSPAEAVEYLTSFVTNAVRDNYGGWGRITEIIVRDQSLIINRTKFMPLIDPRRFDPSMFPMDLADYIQAGAIASLFDWSMLKHMRNLMILDVDDYGFYEINVGGRLKCGRRIGVSTLFNLCPRLEVLILGGDVVNRDDLGNEKSTHVKKKLADHKRFSLFADGYKLNIMKNTNSFADWTFGNLKNYANNKGNKNIFMYCGGVLARAGLAGVAGVVNMGTHLVGGIANVFREAMTPVDASEVGAE